MQDAEYRPLDSLVVVLALRINSMRKQSGLPAVLKLVYVLTECLLVDA
jgi:hypothetical protein